MPAKPADQALRERQKQIDQANPGVLRQDVERFTRSADAAEKAAEQRRLELERLRASLEALGRGPGGAQRGTDVELARAARRSDELTRRARALDLLLVRLTDHRPQLTRQLQAPLQRHLNRYLQLLFPEASLSRTRRSCRRSWCARATAGKSVADRRAELRCASRWA